MRHSGEMGGDAERRGSRAETGRPCGVYRILSAEKEVGCVPNGACIADSVDVDAADGDEEEEENVMRMPE